MSNEAGSMYAGFKRSMDTQSIRPLMSSWYALFLRLIILYGPLYGDESASQTMLMHSSNSEKYAEVAGPLCFLNTALNT